MGSGLLYGYDTNGNPIYLDDHNKPKMVQTAGNLQFDRNGDPLDELNTQMIDVTSVLDSHFGIPNVTTQCSQGPNGQSLNASTPAGHTIDSQAEQNGFSDAKLNDTIWSAHNLLNNFFDMPVSGQKETLKCLV